MALNMHLVQAKSFVCALQSLTGKVVINTADAEYLLVQIFDNILPIVNSCYAVSCGLRYSGSSLIQICSIRLQGLCGLDNDCSIRVLLVCVLLGY